MERISGGITAPYGFLCNGLSAGIKRKGPDMALVYSQHPASAAAVFTTNKIKAAPVRLSMEHVKNGRARAFVANSGNANACTGRRGMEDAAAMAEEAGRLLGLDPSEVLVFSTGIIGEFLPLEKISAKMSALAGGLGRSKSSKAAEAIITTDKFIKETAVKTRVGSGEIRIGAIAKGAGMICPDLATMLCLITTDAEIDPDALGRALKTAVQKSFNRITVDGDCSTNDSVAMLANGQAGCGKIKYKSAGFYRLRDALAEVTSEMAKMIVSDGEGATRFVEVLVAGARSVSDAKTACFGIAKSCLVKTAIAGGNPNWGRIASAAGASGARIDEENMSIALNGTRVMKGGAPAGCGHARAVGLFREPVIRIEVDLGAGNKSFRVWTTDLTEEYVRINKEYC